MVDKNLSMSSYLALRYVEKTEVNFTKKLQYRHPTLLRDEDRISVSSASDIEKAIKRQFTEIFERGYRKLGILLSGGMDSAILASYLPNCDAYTFRFLEGKYQKEELQRAEMFAREYGLTLHYVDICWETVEQNLKPIMKSKGGPVHSIEIQICQAAKQAKEDGVELMIIGDGSDYVFGGMDQLLSKDWLFDEFYHRYVYIEPDEVLKEPVSVRYLFERYRDGEKIDYIKFMDEVATEESYASYSNAFFVGNLKYFDPYAKLRMTEPLDLERVRNGESKYFIRELFKKRYPEIPVPEKLPMPRPVDTYFQDWGDRLDRNFVMILILIDIRVIKNGKYGVWNNF